MAGKPCLISWYCALHFCRNAIALFTSLVLAEEFVCVHRNACVELAILSCSFVCHVGAATVYFGLENSWKILYKNLQYATVETIDHK